MLFADIIIDIALEKLDKSYQYSIPLEFEEQIVVGSLVKVPFGKGNVLKKGYVVNITDKCNYDISRIKPISKLETKGIVATSRVIRLAYWMKEHYGGTVFDALKIIMPVKMSVKERTTKTICVNVNDETLESFIEEAAKKKHVAKLRLLEELKNVKELDYDAVVNKLNISRATVNSLINANIISLVEETNYRNPIIKGSGKFANILPNSEQNTVIEQFKNDYDLSARKTYYIHGITGSGKTLIYIELIKHVIKQGKQAIMLIPEISLTYQTMMRFYDNFGDRISMLNSRMSLGERYDQSMRAKNGEIDIIIGPRSALFVPFEKLGLIIIDEEHESSYKNEGIPKYHTRETAIELARLNNASVVLGSATPSVEAYMKALSGEYKLFTLKNRVLKATLPDVSIVDMREELKAKNRSMLSRKLFSAIEEKLEKKEQIMIFINRRGYAGFVSCRSCGFVFKCPHCDISLTKHFDDKLVCHYCGYEILTPKLCPECNSKYIAAFGTGTQKVEEYFKAQFPKARVLRMDADTTKSKTGHEEILSTFASEEADILIGTQMIVKGHDFKKVTLVGIIAADMSLYANDYRAAERTFQLLTQAAGRAGRAELNGQVIIQTYQPENYCITTSANADYESFYRNEIAFRSLMRYPPVVNMLVIMCTSKKEESAQLGTKFLHENLKTFIEKNYINEKIKIIGPACANLQKVLDTFRKVIYVKCDDYDKLISIKNNLEQLIKDNKSLTNCNIYFDFNPMNSY